MMISKRTILCLALLASTAACSGGGGGGISPSTSGGAAGGGGATTASNGGGGSTTSSGGTTTTPPPVVGSTNFGNPSVVMTNDGTATMASNATSQSVVMSDGEVANPNTPGGFDHKDLLVVNVSEGGVTFTGSGNADFCKAGGACDGKGHVFDLTNDVNGDPNADSAPGKNGIGFTGNGRPTPATANFPNDPTFQVATEVGHPENTVTFDSSLNFSLYGIWEVTDDTTKQPVFGAFAAAGEGAAPAPFASLPSTGSAEYVGKAIALALSGGKTPEHLHGDSDFTANFANMSLSGVVNLRDAQTDAAFATLNYAPGRIVAGTNGQAAVGNSVASADGKLIGTAQGAFFGAPNPTQGTIPPEFGSTFNVSGGGTTVIGSAGGALKH